MREHMTRQWNQAAGPDVRGRGPRRGGHPHGGGRMRRGMTRGLLLAGLIDGPAHGYELMSRLEAKTGGRWRPSPGSVYPGLEQLEDEGLITGHDEDDKRVFTLTDAGRDAADADLFDRFAGPDRADGDLFKEVRALMSASKQVAGVGTSEQIAEATAAVKAARQTIYRLLAE